MGMASPNYYTADMVRAIPDDGQRYEVVRGELLVTPAPRAWHQVVLSRMHVALSAQRVAPPLPYPSRPLPPGVMVDSG